MNISLITNIISASIAVVGYITASPVILSIGLFALSGGLTNWLAVHMLFEKVPGFYGSGVIEAKFDQFISSIESLIMTEFFSKKNIDKFLSDAKGNAAHLEIAPVIEKVNFEPAYDALVNSIKESSFAGMLDMLGGTAVLEPLKQPYINKLKQSIIDISRTDGFNQLLKDNLEQPAVVDELRNKVAVIVRQRLNEMTPAMVKTIVERMIKEHLAWLIIWGAVVGGLFGLVAALI
ncbi:DUF445 family protein [Gayadomonas joobiniege]|uniref:DUF445 family protein n=1 Tax=Gayadomonas joobiniege TaxID=1234606 RepID=UPI00037DE1E0|nr:DUF445 family protein [Gayadomonas joobiniege]